jgi:hypothetical protein
MQRTITIDIETLPEDEASALCGGESAAPPTAAAGDYRETALSGDTGRILCIGFTDAISEGCAPSRRRSGCFGWTASSGRFTCNERGILSDFWELMRDFRPRLDRVVGHNVFDFDLKFIYKRSVINGVRPTVDLSFARYRSQPIFDTTHEWERWSFGPRISLDRLGRLLCLGSSKDGGIDGGTVFDFFTAGQYRAIHDYCMSDVELSRAVYRKMVFAGTEGDGEGRALRGVVGDSRGVADRASAPPGEARL